MSTLKRVVCAISGGVDSAVSALSLKQKGHEVIGVFMKNWDAGDEVGRCTAETDRQDAQYVCDRLGIPLHDVNFVRQYWNHVFLYLLKEYQNGLTPNPDVYCNKYIKFDAFLRHAKEKFDADTIATGHYARIKSCAKSGGLCGGVKLLQSVDKAKDQTLFLSQISQHALRRCLFPVGNMTKGEVRRIACDAGLDRIVRKKESMGICFIGKRDFKKFMETYIAAKPGHFIDIESDDIVGGHLGSHNYTIGQRSLLGGRHTGYFIVKMDPQTQDIFVAPGTHHPSLFSTKFTTEKPHWIHEPPNNPENFRCQFRFQHIHPLINCTATENSNPRLLDVTLDRPLRAITPGQFAVFYDGEECLGSARILCVGKSLYELGETGELEISSEFL